MTLLCQQATRGAALTLSGLAFTAESPSLFHQVNHPVSIGFDGRSWLVAVNGHWGTREFSSREAAADTVAYAYNHAREQLG
jgi:hypothetical protein